MTIRGRYAAATIASRRYMALAKVTARSFIDHNPDIPFFVLLADEDDDRSGLASAPFGVIRLDSLNLPEPNRFRFQYSELEFSYALTPYAIDHLLGEGYQGALFLKQETLVLGELGSVLSGLSRHSALLTPHFIEPPRRVDALTWEINVLLAGIFNGGFLAFANSDEARGFLRWWQEKTFRECTRNVENGVHFEQRWLDFAPCLMPGYGLVRDPGVNVGHWNLPDREIRISGDTVTANGALCRVFRFSGYDPQRPDHVTRYHEHYTVASAGEAAQVFARYHAMLIAAGHEEARHRPYAYESFDNGVAITEAVRRAYRREGDSVGRFGNPFETAPEGSYYRWLKAFGRWRSR